MSVATVRGIDIWYERHGAGPALLHISGTGGDLRTSAPGRMPLNAHFTGVFYDQRGLGRTQRSPHPPTMADFADDAAGLLTALGIDRCAVMGTSFGGMVAQTLAIRHPECVERLVLNCTSPGGSRPSFPLHTLGSLSPSERATRGLQLMDSRYTPGDEELIGIGNVARFQHARQAPDQSPEAEAGRAEQVAARAGHDVEGRLGDIVAPTLVCAGRYDELAPLANSEFIADHIPNAELEVFEGGHLFLLQDPSAFDRIASFLGA